MDYNKNKLIEKWKIVLEASKIDSEYWVDIAMYCQNHSTEHLAPALNILSKLDLSKVNFTKKEICEYSTVSISINSYYVLDMKMQLGIDNVAEKYHSLIIEEYICTLNHIIENHGGLVIGELCSFLEMEGDKLTMKNQTLNLKSYRTHKLKKLINKINGIH